MEETSNFYVLEHLKANKNFKAKLKIDCVLVTSLAARTDAKNSFCEISRSNIIIESIFAKLFYRAIDQENRGRIWLEKRSETLSVSGRADAITLCIAA